MNISSRQLIAILTIVALVAFLLLIFIDQVNNVSQPQGKVSEIFLPETLKKNFHFEPSAILWVEEFGGYLIVSDDTGRGKVKNIPYLFLMDYRGNIQPDMIKLNGIRQIADLESICRDDDGFIYLLGSQSVTSKGKRTAVRELFLKTKIVGKNLMVVSYVSLFKMLENISKNHEHFLEDLAVPDLTKLDIEGMAYHDGKLYLGLNAPLYNDKYALIWCLEHYYQIFETPDDVDAIVGLFSLWAKVPLMSYGQKGVFSGISDMVFTGTGGLVILSGRKDGGFAWHVSEPKTGILDPKIIKKLKGYNPEGLCLTPGQKGMVTLVSDQGKDLPAWFTFKIP